MNLFLKTYSQIQAEEEQRHASSNMSELPYEVGPISQFTPAWRAFVNELIEDGAIRHITRDGEHYVSAQELDAYAAAGSEEACWARSAAT